VRPAQGGGFLKKAAQKLLYNTKTAAAFAAAVLKKSFAKAFSKAAVLML
jgi:hypothetical protein